MVQNKINNFLIPSVTKLPSQKNVDQVSKVEAENSEFKNLLETNIEAKSDKVGFPFQDSADRSSKKLMLSTHALKRLEERNLTFDKDEYEKIQSALDKLKNKGGKDSLVITEKGAYILDVQKNTVVTAMDKASINDNVFTKIDSTILIN